MVGKKAHDSKKKSRVKFDSFFILILEAFQSGANRLSAGEQKGNAECCSDPLATTNYVKLNILAHEALN